MIFEGLKLMLVGMTTVLLFLVVTIWLIKLVSYLTRGAAATELAGIVAERTKQAEARRQKQLGSDTHQDIAVIAAAVATFEAERFAQKS